MPHLDVVICTPGHSVMTQYLKSLLALITELNKRGLSWGYSSEYSSHVGDAREITVSGTFNNSLTEQRPFEGHITYSTLLWIDSDIAFLPEDALKLIESDKDIITGAYLLSSGEVTVYPTMLKSGLTFDQVKEMTDLIKIEACGLGFIAVKSGVFESLTRPWFQSAWITPESGTPFPILGEDMSWCKRVTDAGFEIWFDPTVRVQHHKMMKLTWEGVMP